VGYFQRRKALGIHFILYFRIKYITRVILAPKVHRNFQPGPGNSRRRFGIGRPGNGQILAYVFYDLGLKNPGSGDKDPQGLALIDLPGTGDAVFDPGFLHFNFFPEIIQLGKKILGSYIVGFPGHPQPPHQGPDTNIQLILRPKERRRIFNIAFYRQPAKKLNFFEGKSRVLSFGKKLNPRSLFFLFGAGNKENYHSQDGQNNYQCEKRHFLNFLLE
jgi:hypothetical protein